MKLYYSSFSSYFSLLGQSVVRGVHYTKAVLERMRREDILHDVINLVNKQGQSPLFAACIKNEASIVKLLLEANADPTQECFVGPDVNRRPRRFLTPLHYVSERGQLRVDVLKVLLEHEKTDINKHDSNCESARELSETSTVCVGLNECVT